jgi:hypothetical protein
VECGKRAYYIVTIPRADFLQYRNAIRVGAGDIQDDIAQARKMRAGRLKKKLVCHHHVVSEFVYVLLGG